MTEHEQLREEVSRLKARIAELQQRSPQEPADFLEAVFRTLPAFVLRFDAELRINFTSRVVAGLPEAQVLGRSALEFIPPEDREKARAVALGVLRTGEPGSYETTGPGPDGESRRYDVYVGAVPTGDGRREGCFIAQDISRVHAQQRALAESEQKLRIAQTATGLGLWRWDLTTGELIWDEAMKQLVGRSEALALPDYVEKVVHPDDRHRVRESGERTFTAGRFEPISHRIVRPDGEVRWMLTVGELERDELGRPVRVMGGNLDVTEHRAVEERLRHAEQLEAVGRLTAGVAHNFNNMLAVMLPNLELLRPRVSEADRVLVDDAVDAADRAADMVRKLMRFAGQRPLWAPAACDVGQLARRIVSMCERTFDPRLTLALEVVDGCPTVIAGASDLEQVLMNLLLNARDAVLEAGGPSPRIDVAVHSEPARAGLPTPGPEVVLRVKDNGPGLSDLARRHAFEPFFTSKEVGRGTGLGLATSYAIIRDLKGLIELDSTPGEGTTVTVRLPAHTGAAPVAEPTHLPAMVRAVSVLVVDDEPLVRQVTSRMLDELGYRVRTADSGAGALCELSRERCDLVLLDRSLPGTSGDSLVAAVRSVSPRSRILYFSGADVSPEELRAADGFIAKPVRMDALAQALARYSD